MAQLLLPSLEHEKYKKKPSTCCTLKLEPKKGTYG